MAYVRRSFDPWHGGIDQLCVVTASNTTCQSLGSHENQMMVDGNRVVFTGSTVMRAFTRSASGFVEGARWGSVADWTRASRISGRVVLGADYTGLYVIDFDALGTPAAVSGVGLVNALGEVALDAAGAIVETDAATYSIDLSDPSKPMVVDVDEGRCGDHKLPGNVTIDHRRFSAKDGALDGWVGLPTQTQGTHQLRDGLLFGSSIDAPALRATHQGRSGLFALSAPDREPVPVSPPADVPGCTVLAVEGDIVMCEGADAMYVLEVVQE